MDSGRTDLLDRPLSTLESELLASYERLAALLDADLPPCARANVEEALAALWQALNDLLLDAHASR